MDSDAQLIDALCTIFGEEVQYTCLSTTNDERFLAVENENNRSVIVPIPSDAVFNITAIDLEDNNRIHYRATHPNGSNVLGLLAINQQHKAIHLLAVDHCVLSSADPKRCDCLLFDNQFLCFVEFKLDVEKKKNATSNLNSARKQLATSIQFFGSQLTAVSPTVFGFKPEAYAVLRTNVYPKKRSQRETVFVKFLEETGVPLFEANVKQF